MQQLFGFLGVTAALVVFTQPAWADIVQVTGVQVNPTESGIEVVVKTNSYCRGENLQIRCNANGTVSQVSQSSSDNTFIVDINNAQLQLPKGNTFSQDNPVTGITSVTVTPLNNTTIRIAVTGEAQVPDVEVIPTNGSVTLSVFSDAIATDADTPEAETQAEEIEINVVGRRSPTPQTETPATVDIKTEEELEREQPLTRTVGEALQTLPGITINRLGLLSGSANIRGLTGERIGVLVDGERLPNLEFGPDLGSIDPFRVERIEVLKGPASSIYGADAFGGVINILTTTPRPDRPFKVRTYTYGGGFAELNGNLEVQGPNFVIGTSGRTAGDARDAEGDIIPPEGTEYKVFDLYGSGRVDLSDRDRLELRFDRYRQDDADLNNFPEIFIEAKNVFRNRDRYSLAYINEGSGSTSFSLRGYYQRSKRRFDNTTQVNVSVPTFRPFGPPIFRPLTITTPSSTLSLTETYGFSAVANSRLGESAILTYGYDFSQDASTFLNRLNNVDSPLGTRTFNGIFLQSSYTVIPKLTFTAGTRFDIFNANSGDQENDADAVTFNVGSIYRFTDALSARINFAQGFRPPNLLNLFGSEADGTFFAPTRGRVRSDPNLESERANNIDIGVDYTTQNFIAGVTFFRNDISDFQGFEGIVPLPAPRFGPPQAAVRVANKDVLIEGVEFSLAYKFSPQWTLQGNLTVIDSEEKDSGRPLNQLEDFPTTALIRLLYDNGRFSGYLQSRIYGDQGEVILTDNQIGSGSSGAAVFDLSLGYRLTPTTQLTLSVENLFDNQFTFPTVNFPAPGIRFLAGLRADF